MPEFEAACAERGIDLVVLPPRSPKFHGAVERANRTHTEEFYEVTDAPAELDALRACETIYNTIRPHQPLGHLTNPDRIPRRDRVAGLRTYRTSTHA
jgi:putative transposase